MPIEIVLTCEHAGNEVPSPFVPLFRQAPEILDTHRGYDIGAYELTNIFAGVLKKEPHIHKVTRLLVDLNRSLDNPTAFSEYSGALDEEEKEEVVSRYYLPHRQKVEKVISGLVDKDITVLHLAIHTFTPEMDGITRDADIGLLFDPARPREKEFCEEWRRRINRECPELHVRMNYPYKGTMDGFTTYLRGELPEEQYWGIELEVNQKFVESGTGPLSWKELGETIAAGFAEAKKFADGA